MNSLVSIGIPFYNNEKTIEIAIKSTLNQTYKNIEIILVNDGSKDNSIEIATKYAALDSRIRIINDHENRGLIYRLNQIIDSAQGKYLARMDADDLMDPARIEKQISVIEYNSEVDVVTTGLISLDNGYVPLGKRCCSTNVPDVYQVFKNGDQLLHASMLAKKSWFLMNKYLTGFDRAEDRELFTRTIGTSFYSIIPEPLYYYLDVQNMNLQKHLKSYDSERKALVKNWKTNISVIQFIWLYFRSCSKSIIIRIIFLIGKQETLLKNKNVPLTDKEKERAQSFLKRTFS